jgi:hypothetical protein
MWRLNKMQPSGPQRYLEWSLQELERAISHPRNYDSWQKEIQGWQREVQNWTADARAEGVDLTNYDRKYEELLNKAREKGFEVLETMEETV